MASRQIVVVGGPGVGKTTLLRQLQQNRSLAVAQQSEEYAPSAGAELLKVPLGSAVSVDLFDTPGQERWRALCDGYVSQAHGLVVVLEVLVQTPTAASRDCVHAPALAAAQSWLGRSLPTLLLGLRTPSQSARPDLQPQELPRSEDNPQSLPALARATGALFAYADCGSSGATGVEAALLGLVAAIDAERSRYGDGGGAGRSPRRVTAALHSTASSESNTSLNDSGDVPTPGSASLSLSVCLPAACLPACLPVSVSHIVAEQVQRLLAGIGGVLDADSSTDSVEAPSNAAAAAAAPVCLSLPSRGSVFARFERHAGPGSKMNAAQFHELAEELWPEAEELDDSVRHAVAAAATSWPIDRHGAMALLQLVTVVDRLAAAVGRRQGSLPSSLGVGDFSAAARAINTGRAISDADAVSAFVKFGGAGGFADIEEVIVWLADYCSSASETPPPKSPRDTGRVGHESDDEQGREQVTQEAGRAAWATERSEEREGGEKPRGRAGQRLSIEQQEELMAKIEADPDNMDLLMQLQEVHRSLSIELASESGPEGQGSTDNGATKEDQPGDRKGIGKANSVSNAAALDALQASEDHLRGLIRTAKLLENEVGSDEDTVTDGGDGLDSSAPSAVEAEAERRGAAGRRSSWADGGSAKVATVEPQTSDGAGDTRSLAQQQSAPPTRERRSLFSGARSKSRTRSISSPRLDKERTNRPGLALEDHLKSAGSGGGGSASLAETVAATVTKTVAEERVEQLTAMREQMTQVLEEEREHRKRTAATLGNRKLFGTERSIHSLTPEKAPRRASVTATVRGRAPRVAELARRVSPQRMRVRRSEAKGFGTSSPARVRKSSRAAGSEKTDSGRRADSPAAVPRVATLAAAVAADMAKTRAHPHGAKKGFGASGSRDTNPAVWSSSVKGVVPSAHSPLAAAEREEETSRSPKATSALMRPAAKAALRWMNSPTQSSAAKRAAALSSTAALATTGSAGDEFVATKRKTKKGFGSSASRGVGGSPRTVQRNSEGDGRDDVLSDRVVDLINRLVPAPSNDSAESGNRSGSPLKPHRREKYSNPAKRGFGTSSPARLTNAWLAPEEAPAGIRAVSHDNKSERSELTGFETVDDWGHDLDPDAEERCEEQQDENWGQRETDEALDSEEEQAKQVWNEAAQSEALLAQARQRERMAELHAVQKRLIVEIEEDPDNLSLLQNLAQVDRAMALAINAGAAPPSGRSPPQATQQDQGQQQTHSHSTQLEPDSPSRVERARRAAAKQQREEAKRRAAEHRHQREMERLEKARRDAERREAARNRPTARATSPGTRLASGLSRLLRPKSASDNAQAAERRQKRIVQARKEAQKELTFQPQVPKDGLPSPQQQHTGSSLSLSMVDGDATAAEPEGRPEPEVEPVSDRLYREGAQRAQRRSTREEQQQAIELAGCTFSPNIPVTRTDKMKERRAAPVARRLDLEGAAGNAGSQTSGKSLRHGALSPDCQDLCGRMFDMVDTEWSGQLSVREINGFCAAMVQSAQDSAADAQAAKACAAVLMGTAMAVAKANGSGASVTKQQFVQTTPGNTVLSQLERPYYDDVLAFCRSLAADPTRKERYVAAAAVLSAEQIEEARRAVLFGKDQPEERCADAPAESTEPAPADMSDDLSASQSEAQDVVARSRTWQADRDAKIAERRAALLKRQEDEEKALYKPFRANPAPPPPPPAKNTDRHSPKRVTSPKRALPIAATEADVKTEQQRNRSPAQQRKAAAKLSGSEPSQPTLRQRRFLAEAAVSAVATR